MDHPYGTNVMFGDSVFLVGCNRLAAVIFAIGMSICYGESLMWKAPLWKYAAVSLSNVYASTCQYEALKYVSFPVQMLGKSFKMMPVMVWGIIVSQKRYKLSDWLIAAAVTGGVTEFLMTGPISSSSAETGTSFHGLALLLCFLLLDGFTSNYQEMLFKEYKTSKFNQMLYVNGASFVISTITLFASGGLFRSFNFIYNYPALLFDASLLSASGVASQFCILSQVKEFGALVFAATMNVRQVVSIIVSYVKYGHMITWLQVLGLMIVFAALFYKSLRGLWQEKKDPEKEALIQKGQEKDNALPEASSKNV